MPMAVIISISVLFFPLVPHFACAAGFVQSRSSPSELFNAPVVGRQGREVWDVVVGRAAAGEGRGACRTMTLAFNAGRSQALEMCCGVYTERVLQGLDLVISKARKNGIRLILCLTKNNKDIASPIEINNLIASPISNRMTSGEADSKPLYGGGQNLEHFPDMHREIQHRFLLDHGKSPPASPVVVSHVKTVPPSKPSGWTKIPSHDKGHCPPT